MSQHVAALTLRVIPGQQRICVIPAGRFEAPRGAMAGAGPWNLTQEGAARIIARNASRQADILVDYEHQLLNSKDNGKEVPAAGWINPRSLTWVEEGTQPGLYGAVQWTAKALEMIAADQYRYLSPVFSYDKATGEPTDLLNVALTNFPAVEIPTADSPMATLTAAHDPRLSPVDHKGVEHFNRSFAALGILHPDTDRAIAALGMTRAGYMAALGAGRT